ncbi:MAG: hypothetical protein EOP47_28045 [Sphingobacteriaceae bacterium]|nr:MAG: hypothetical protein EOP47_28045 [Sphingobacteriaceae bacterium]
MNSYQGNRFFFNVDWVTVLIYIALCIIGWVNIYAVIYDPEAGGMFKFSSSYGRQLIFIISC